jgi:hypothetical protein
VFLGIDKVKPLVDDDIDFESLERLFFESSDDCFFVSIVFRRFNGL